MRHLAFGSTLILLFLFSCKKNNLDTPNSIVGNWELSVVYYSQGVQMNYPSGNGNIIEFTPTTYKIYLNSQLAKSGQYKLLKDTFHLTGELRDRIIYDNKYDSIRTFVQIPYDNRLRLTIDANNAITTVYRRQ